MDEIVKRYHYLSAQLKCINCMLKKYNYYKSMHPHSCLIDQHIIEATARKREIIADIDSLANQVPFNFKQQCI